MKRTCTSQFFILLLIISFTSISQGAKNINNNRLRDKLSPIDDYTEYGSGDTGFYYDEENLPTLFDDEDFENVIEGSASHSEPTRPLFTLLPTPTFDFAPSSSVFRDPLLAGPSSTYLPDLASISDHPWSSSLHPTKSSHAVSSSRIPYSSADDSFGFPHIGSGDGPIPIQPTPSIPVLSSSTPEVQNTPPRVIQSIPKQLINAGEYFEYQVPESIFFDHEQEDLSLSLLFENRTLNDPNGWIVLDKWNIKAYPSAEEISDYEFRLRARDYFNASADTLFYVSVRQRQKSRNWNHLFVFQFGKVGSQYRIEWIKELADTVKALVGGDLVLVERNTESHPFTAAFVNESLVTGEAIQNEYVN